MWANYGHIKINVFSHEFEVILFISELLLNYTVLKEKWMDQQMDY